MQCSKANITAFYKKGKNFYYKNIVLLSSNMLHVNYFLIFEAIGFISFILLALREIYHKNFHRLFELASCAVFGVILEIGNTYLAHTYSYSENFLVQLAHVPITIGLGWAVIIYCAMLLSDQYNIPWTLRPFMDALTAITLDLAMDAVAIRLGFWTWAIPLDGEWYGVPYENLVGWIFVVLSFSFLIRFIRTLNPRRVMTKVLMIFSPIISYVGLTIGLFIFILITVLPYGINSNWSNLLQFNYTPNFNILFNPQVQSWKSVFLVVIIVELINIVVWSIIYYRKKWLKYFDLLSFSALTSIHLFFTIAIFTTGLYKELPILVWLCITSLIVHLLLHFLPYLINRKTVYFLGKAKEEAEVQLEKIEKVIDASLK